ASDIPVSTLGDFDGSGLSDLLIGDLANNTAHIIYDGTNGGNLATQSQIEITADAGWTLAGGGSVGDFDGDGLDDAVLLFQNGNVVEGYVVYGGLGDGDYTQTDLLNDPFMALRLDYDAKGGTNLTVSGVGDLNGDGFDDFAIGNSGAAGGQGEVVVVNGMNTGAVQAGNTVNNDGYSIVGGGGAQTLSDGGNDDVSMRGGRGDDVFRLFHRDGPDDASFLNIDGGSGYDYLSIQGGDIDFTNVQFEQLSGVEEIRAQAAGQTITLSMENIFNMLKTVDTQNGGNDLGLYLRSGGFGGVTFNIDVDTVSGITPSDPNVEDGVEILADSIGATASDNPGPVDVIEIGGYNLYIGEDVTVNVI
ncbi:MAG: FG-GAP repeat protein, partial [Pseudomonadota bacterium]